MRSPSAAWSAAARTEPRRPVYLITIRWASSAVEGVDQLTLATRPGTGYAASVQDPGLVGSSVDPITREMDLAQSTIQLRRDVLTRKLIEGRRLRNKDLVVRLGFVGLAESDYLYLATLRILDAVPSSDGLTISIKCARKLSVLTEKKTNLMFVNRHPSQAMQDLIDWRGFPSAGYDASTFAPDYFERIAHWNLSRFRDPATYDWVPLRGQNFGEATMRELINGLLQITSTSIVEDGDGVARLKRYDKNAAPVRHFRRRDVLEMRPVSVTETIYNAVTVRFGLNGGDAKSALYQCTLKDATSQTNYGYPDGTPYEAPLVIDTEWMNAIGMVAGADPVRSGEGAGLFDISTSFVAQFSGLKGFSGGRFNVNNTQDPSAELTDDNYAYLMLTGGDVRVNVSGGGFVRPTVPEIVRVNRCVRAGTNTVLWEGGEGSPSARYPWQFIYYFDTTAPNGGRAQFETSPVVPVRWKTGATIDSDGLGVSAQDRTIVCDVTPAVDFALNVLERSSDGIADVELRVNVEHGDLEVMDFVTFDDDVFLAYGIDGATSGTTWEIISEEPHVMEDAPGWLFRLRRVRTDTVTPVKVDVSSGYFPPTTVVLADLITDNDGVPVTEDYGDQVYGG